MVRGGRGKEATALPDLPSPMTHTEYMKVAFYHWLDEAHVVSCEKDTHDCRRAGRCFQ